MNGPRHRKQDGDGDTIQVHFLLEPKATRRSRVGKSSEAAFRFLGAGKRDTLSLDTGSLVKQDLGFRSLHFVKSITYL